MWMSPKEGERQDIPLKNPKSAQKERKPLKEGIKNM